MDSISAPPLVAPAPPPRAVLTEEPAPVLRVWIGPELAAELPLEPARALALAEALVAAARRALAREAPLAWPPPRDRDATGSPDPGPPAAGAASEHPARHLR